MSVGIFEAAERRVAHEKVFKLPVRKENARLLLEDFAEIGMDVRTVRKWGRKRTVIDTGTNKMWAQIVWSLLDDECLVQERQTSQPTSEQLWTKTYQSWYPAHYALRLWMDSSRRIALVIFAVLTAIPAVVVLGFHLNPFSEEAEMIADAIFVATLSVPLVYVWWWLRYKGLDIHTLPYRFLLGLVAGLVWTAATGVPTLFELVGAYWVFAVSNLLWMGTVGWDRQLHEDRLGDVGGRLTWRQAIDRLQEEKRRVPLRILGEP